jgi:glycerol-3-phosphate cytidylyltransferase
MKIGIIFSSWDLLHPGHLYTLRECKNRCDFLIVGLHIGGRKKKLVETVFERWMRLYACRYVDKIVPYETEEDLVNMLYTSGANVRFLGEDYVDRRDITGKDILPIEYIQRKHNWSSTELRKKI